MSKSSAQPKETTAIGHNGGPPLNDTVDATTGEEPKAPFHVQVTTTVPGTSLIVDSRICDIYDFQARKWLTNHQFWAMHNGHTVELHPATPDEITSYTQKQAQLLSRRYGRN